ncbi:EAL domain-containing protein, partial [Gottfriedia acidiceleris]|uniref:EAL domain-containing protein n=1 Tax=Gottfriedia acidiceleris TaxID=371036 RepID=UPI0030009326
ETSFGNPLKIDRSFIQNMTENPKNFSLVKAIIKMGHSLGFKFVAEGVETEEQMKMLKNLNCDIGQGYYFNRPLPLEEICTSMEIGIN